MERELNGLLLKYEEGKIFVWREKRGNQTLKNPDWRELKGCVCKSNGYRLVSINYKLYRFHRVVYFIHNQEWDIHDSSMDNSIDHRDRNPLNNSIENLRVVTHTQNQWNKDANGYSFHKPTGKYEARIKVNYKKKHLGLFVSEDDARNAYLLAKEKYHIF